MNKSDHDLSDETLVAYLNGQLSRLEADMVADALNDSPALAARLKAMEIPISELRPALEKMLDKMPPGTVPERIKQPKSQISLKRPLVVLVALVVGIGIGAALF